MASDEYAHDEESEHLHARNRASEFIDDELTDEEAARVKSHIEKCPPCTAFFNTLRATIRLLRLTRLSDTPASFTKSLRERIGRLTD